MKYYSQFGEDQWIAENLTIPKDGFFIEIGCGADGTLHSNSKFFEDIGWKGFLIEADPSAIELIRKSRSCPVFNYAVHKEDGYIDFYIYPDKEYSSTVRPNENKVVVKTICLKNLLENIGCKINIDLMSIDTEGSEIEILDGMEDIRPKTMIVEYNTAMYRNDVNLIKNKLISLGYNIRHVTTCNVIATLNS